MSQLDEYMKPTKLQILGTKQDFVKRMKDSDLNGNYC